MGLGCVYGTIGNSFRLKESITKAGIPNSSGRQVNDCPGEGGNADNELSVVKKRLW